MSRFKVTLELAGDGAGRAAESAWRELLDPPADAVTRFACPAGWRLEAYFALPPDRDALAALITGEGAPPPALAIAEVPDLNWVAISQAALPPVTAGRLTVHGSHDRGRVGRGPWRIEIDAGEAFGTAHHATTGGSLAALDRLARCLDRPRQGARRHARRPAMLDLGTGSGVLAIALARLLPQARITASDVDPVAAGVACANVRLNGVGTQVGVTVADGLPRARPSRAGRHDLIVANILAGPLARLAPRVTGALRPGGLLVLSGILVPQAAGVVARYGGLGARLIRHDRIAGWSTLTLVQTRQRPAPGAGAGRWGSCGRWRLRRSGGRRPKPVSRRGG